MTAAFSLRLNDDASDSPPLLDDEQRVEFLRGFLRGPRPRLDLPLTAREKLEHIERTGQWPAEAEMREQRPPNNRRFDPAIIDRIRACIDLPELVSARTELRRSGSGYLARCIFHDDRTPSLSLFRRGDVWRFRCHGCQEHGDGIDFIERTDGLSFRDAVVRAAAIAGIELPSVPASRAERRRSRREADARAHDWHLLRKLDERVASLATRATIEAHEADQETLRWECLWKRTLEKHGDGHYLTNIAANALAKAYNAREVADYRFETLNAAANPRTSRVEKARLLLALRFAEGAES